MSKSFGAWIMSLAIRSGYDYAFLCEMWEQYTSDALDKDEPIDLDYFAGVTLEKDW